jgi:uncharacterized RDD family membrane protein YckC
VSATRTAALQPAGFWHRYAAWSLDALVLSAGAMALAWPRLQLAWGALAAASRQLLAAAGQAMADLLMAGMLLPQMAGSLLHDPALVAGATAVQAALWALAWPLLLGYALLAALWHVGGTRSRWRGSPGKHALGLSVTDLDGNGLSLARAALRHGAALLSWLTLNLGHVLAMVPPQKRALHDYIAGTRVVRDAGDARLPRWAAAWVALQLTVMVLLLAWMLLRYVAALQATALGL